MHLGQLANCFNDFNDDIIDRSSSLTSPKRYIYILYSTATITVLLQQQHKVPRQAQLPQQFHTT